MRRLWAFLVLIGLVSGCANVVDLKLMSDKSIFLAPGSAKTIYIQNRNISENQQVSLADLGGRLAAKGYQVLQDPDQAQFLLQTKVVYCNKEGENVSLQSVLAAGFGTGIGSANTGMGGMPDVAAMMARMGMGAPRDETVLYFCAVDVQVTEQGARAAAVSPVPAGPPGDGKGHQIRMAAGVKQKKLDIEEATPILREKLTTGIAGMF
ncbi:MAG: complement resistance protein TraT [Anaerolineales bacterium]